VVPGHLLSHRSHLPTMSVARKTNEQTERNQQRLQDSHYSETHIVRIKTALEGKSRYSMLCSVGYGSQCLDQCHT